MYKSEILEKLMEEEGITLCSDYIDNVFEVFSIYKEKVRQADIID